MEGGSDSAKLHEERDLDPQFTEHLLHKQGQIKFRFSFSLLETCLKIQETSYFSPKFQKFYGGGGGMPPNPPFGICILFIIK